MSRIILEGLYSSEYEHPFDRDALDRLEKTRGLDLLTEKVLDYGLEKYSLIKHTGNNIRITAENVPELFNILMEASEILEMPEVPELYIMLEDKIKSFTSGQHRKVIVISSGAVDLLNQDELLFLLGRELGHIKSSHVLYRMMAESLKSVTQFVSDISLGIGNLITMPLQAALLHWFRMSEFTADRAGLLTCQDPDIAGKALIKMAGLPQQYHGKVTVKDLRMQATQFDDIQETTFDKLIQFVATYENTQPFTIIRASQLYQWIDSGEYARILSRQDLAIVKDRLRCPSCQEPFTPDENFCRHCGQKLQ